MAERGLLITLEGPEGSGKTSQIAALRQALQAEGRRVRTYAEPGGTRISEAVRGILLDERHTEMAPRAEVLLFLAARAQLVEQEIRPALAEGCIVLCDRFTDSTLAYQSVSSGLPLAELAELNRFATGNLQPDRTVLLDVDPRVGLERQGEWNRMEARGVAFHDRVREVYRQLAEREPERIRRVDAGAAPAQVAEAIRAALADLLG